MQKNENIMRRDPAAWQNFPSSALPPELRDRNERGIRRLVDGEYSTGDVE